MKGFNWNEQNTAELRRLRGQGASFSQIARSIGCPSRNAVIGKAHRLGLDRVARPAAKVASIPPLKSPEKENIRPQNIARKAQRRAEERREMFEEIADKAIQKFEATVAVSPEPVRFLDRGHFQCAMPQPGWDDAPVTEKMVCGAPVVAATSWCRACLQIVSATESFSRYKTRVALEGVAA